MNIHAVRAPLFVFNKHGFSQKKLKIKKIIDKIDKKVNMCIWVLPYFLNREPVIFVGLSAGHHQMGNCYDRTKLGFLLFIDQFSRPYKEETLRPTPTNTREEEITKEGSSWAPKMATNGQGKRKRKRCTRLISKPSPFSSLLMNKLSPSICVENLKSFPIWL